MSTVFSRILAGELPARFVYRDEAVAAFLTIAPLRPGHTLVIPTAEIDNWLDLSPELTARLFTTAQQIAAAVQRAFDPARVALLVLGLEVAHVHLHLVPIDDESQVELSRADHHPDPAILDDAAARIRAALADGGYLRPPGS